MTSDTLNFHVSKNVNISKTKQDIEKLKTPLRLIWKCCSVVFKIRSTIFSLQGHFKQAQWRSILRFCGAQLCEGWIVLYPSGAGCIKPV